MFSGEPHVSNRRNEQPDDGEEHAESDVPAHAGQGEQPECQQGGCDLNGQDCPDDAEGELGVGPRPDRAGSSNADGDHAAGNHNRRTRGRWFTARPSGPGGETKRPIRLDRSERIGPLSLSRRYFFATTQMFRYITGLPWF